MHSGTYAPTLRRPTNLSDVERRGPRGASVIIDRKIWKTTFSPSGIVRLIVRTEAGEKCPFSHMGLLPPPPIHRGGRYVDRLGSCYLREQRPPEAALPACWIGTFTYLSEYGAAAGASTYLASKWVMKSETSGPLPLKGCSALEGLEWFNSGPFWGEVSKGWWSFYFSSECNRMFQKS